MSASIFISYRRDDSGAEVNALRMALHAQVGGDSVIVDTSLRGGTVWPDAIRQALDSATVILAVIGPNWLTAGSDQWGQRRIDQEDDWVRQELTIALAAAKHVVPVLVDGAKMPPRSALPAPLQNLPERTAIEIRRDYWDHDVQLVLAQVQHALELSGEPTGARGPYPHDVPEGPEAIDAAKLQRALTTDLKSWTLVESALPENPGSTRRELFRELRFRRFVDAIRFMSQVAPGCDIAMHHPRWENIWKTLRVYLTTWDIGHRVSDRDLQLARYFDRVYAEFDGAARPAKPL